MLTESGLVSTRPARGALARSADHSHLGNAARPDAV